MTVESRPGSLKGLPDDRLGTIAVSLVVSELQWAPDVAPAAMDRIHRDAVTYPEQFDRRVLARPAEASSSAAPSERSAKRAVGRLAIFGVILAVIVALVLFAATASGADAPTASTAAPVPIRAIDGTLFDQGGRIPLVVTEAS